MLRLLGLLGCARPCLPHAHPSAHPACWPACLPAEEDESEGFMTVQLIGSSGIAASGARVP